MLSYQHMYHAGNLADVHKHALLSHALAYLVTKEKPLSYFETHAGRGLYDLDSDPASRTGEAAQGIARMGAYFPTDHPYSHVLSQVRQQHGPSAYPGSPLVAALSLRPGDKMYLAELHPQEYAALTYVMSPYPAQIHQQDGAAMALAISPPTPRRGLCLIDPSYEIKDDYRTIPDLIRKLHRKWPVGIIMLWYPLLDGGAHRPMLTGLQDQFPDALRHEVTFPPARPGHRMQGSGLFIINPPYGLDDEAARLSAVYAQLRP
jgi:23S rRNA (adenine2030-N6)-methyltransferase